MHGAEIKKAQGMCEKRGGWLKDFLVTIVRRGEILIRADNVEEAAAMAGRFGFDFDDSRLNNRFEIYVEATFNDVNQDSNYVKHVKKGKKHKAKKRKYAFINMSEDIPF